MHRCGGPFPSEKLRLRPAVAAVLAGIVLPAGAALAQTSTGTIEGRVLSAADSAAVSGATVLLVGTPLGTFTDETGSFELTRLRSGSYVLRIVAPGYESAELTEVAVGEGETRRVGVSLTQSVVEIPGIVVTASRGRARPGETPASVAVLGGEEILRRNVNTLDEALPFTQGVISNAGQLDIRGASGISRGVGSRVLVLLDGHRLLKGVGSEADFETLPLLDVERVEVVKGPNSSLYGTSAVGGVINVITARPPERPETVVKAYYGAWDTPSRYRFTDEALSRQGLAVQHSRWIGKVGTTLYVGSEGSDGFHQNGGHSRWQARLKTVFPAGSDRPVEAFVNWTQRDDDEFFTWLSEDRPLEVDSVELGDWLREQDLAIGVTARPVNSQSMLLQVRPQFVYNKVQNHFHDNEDYHRSSRLGADAQLSFNPWLRHAVSTGVEASGTSVSSDFLLGDPYVVDLAAFAQDEFEISDRLRGTLGVRLDYHDAEQAEDDLVLNPKLGAVYQLARNVGLRASLSRGYRAPSVSEQYSSTTQFGFRIVPNLELMGERAWAAELGATAELGGWLILDGAAFYSDYTGLIEPRPVPGQLFTFQFQNVTEARVAGLDAGAQVGLFGRFLSLKANYVFLDTEDKLTGQPLPYRSRHNLTGTVEALRGLVGVDVRYRSRVDEVLVYPLDDRGDITVFDFRLAYRFRDWVIMGKVENVFQESYVDVQERKPGGTRHFRLTIIPRF